MYLIKTNSITLWFTVYSFFYLYNLLLFYYTSYIYLEIAKTQN